MVHVRVLEAYINFTLIYIADRIFPELSIKYLINEDGEPTTPFKLTTGMKPSVSHLRVSFYPFVLQKATARFETKVLNMCHQAQKCFCGIFVGIPQHQKGYLVYVPHRQKIVSSYHVLFDEIFSSALAYKSQLYAEAMAMRPSVSYVFYAKYSRGETGDIITLAHFEEVGGVI